MSLDSDLHAGFQVKYLGSVAFTRKKRQPLKGIVSLQRPLLDLYTEARRRGESHRSIHPLALTQQLEVCDYGLVVAEGTSRGETVITKVVTPLSNVVLWAAVRFHARIIKKRVFGAAFVPLACSDGVLDHKSYICLQSKQRFLVSLTHPSVFACIYRSVSNPNTYECHAFVCATAEDALAVASLATGQSSGDGLSRHRLFLGAGHRRRIANSVDSGTDYYTPSDGTPGYGTPLRENVLMRTDTEEESNSYASVPHKPSSRRRYALRPPPRKRFTNHREARALVGRAGVPGRPLPEDEHLWRMHQRRYEMAEPDRVPSSLPEDGRYREHRHTRTDKSNTEQYREPLNSTEQYRIDKTTTDQYRESRITTDQYREPRNTTDQYRTISTMTDESAAKKQPVGEKDSSPPPTETLAETIDLSSESASSTGGWRPLLQAKPDPPPRVKYTYFGYETYAKPAADNGMGEQRRTDVLQKDGGQSGGVIKGNGTGKVVIAVPFNRPDSRNSSSSRVVGVRTFQKHGHPRNWSSLSHTSASSSSSYRATTTQSTSRRRPPSQPKVIRWSSDDRLPRSRQGGGGGFFLSLKRLSIQSLTKAKHKTGKFISSMKTRIMGTKRSSADGSEDSAYDTSEVCLSPSGRQLSSSPARQPAPARRQQSWSFHDLRSAAVEKPVVKHRRKHRRRSRKQGRSSSSSDSGVEAAYHSDNSGRKSVSDPGRLASKSGVTRVKVEHGMGDGTFQRWSHTNIQDELGYIP